jgi:DNA invertase Pin-like site-specific DNA recombinase
MNHAIKAMAHEIKIRQMANFYSAAERRSRGILWPSFAPALIVVLVWACDRIARSTKHFLEVLDELNRLNIEFISFREQIDTGGPLGRAVVIIIGAIAELEGSLIVERVRAGMRRPKLEGRHIGRKALVLDRAAIHRDRQQGHSLGQLAKCYLVSRTTIHRVLGEQITVVTKGVEKPAA